MSAQGTRFLIDDSHMLQCSLSDVLSIKAEAIEETCITDSSEHVEEAVTVDTYIEETEVGEADNDAHLIEEGMDGDAMRQHTLELRQEGEKETYFCIECDMEYASIEEITAVHGHDADVEVVEEQQWEPVADVVEEINVKREAADVNACDDEMPGENDETLDSLNVSQLEMMEEVDKYLCEKCQLIFEDLETAEQHVCESDEFNVFIKQENDSEEFLLEENNTQANKVVLQHPCKPCNISFDTLKALHSHRVEKHPNDFEPFICEKCGKKFKTLKTLVTHSRRGCKSLEEKKVTQPSVCDICNTQFATEKSLKFHMRIHRARTKKSIQDVLPVGSEKTYSELNQFFCEICNKSFDQNLLTVHKNMHQNVELHVCGICNRQFENLTSYEMHLQLHATQEDPQKRFPIRTEGANGEKLPHVCQYCGRAFGRPYEKVKHERIHTGEKPYECEVCGKCFRVSYSLTMHLRTHTDIRPYVCSVCNARFKSKPVYAHHVRSHQNERPYKCDTCPKSFRTSVRLNAHRNSHRKPFTCTECNRPFASLYAVKMHMKTHNKAHKANENLKHRCNICGAEYARSFALRYHMHDAHQVTLDGVENEMQQMAQQQDIYDIIIQQTDDDNIHIETVVCNEVVETERDENTGANNEVVAATASRNDKNSTTQMDTDNNNMMNTDFDALNETERATQMISNPNNFSYGIYFLD